MTWSGRSVEMDCLARGPSMHLGRSFPAKLRGGYDPSATHFSASFQNTNQPTRHSFGVSPARIIGVFLCVPLSCCQEEMGFLDLAPQAHIVKCQVCTQTRIRVSRQWPMRPSA